VSTTETTAPMTPGPAGVPRWQPQFVTVRASRWFKNGDHPQDDCRMIKPDPASTTQFGPFLSEGQVVRRYRSPDDDGQRCCGDCRSLTIEAAVRANERARIRRGVLAREMVLRHPEDGDRVAVLTLDLEQIIGAEDGT
jgi:hypothetical protein